MSRTGARDRARQHLAMAMDYVDQLEAALQDIADFARNYGTDYAPDAALRAVQHKAQAAYMIPPSKIREQVKP